MARLRSGQLLASGCKGMLLGEKPDFVINQAALEQSGLGHLFPSGLHLAMAVNLIALGAPRWGQYMEVSLEPALGRLRLWPGWFGSFH